MITATFLVVGMAIAISVFSVWFLCGVASLILIAGLRKAGGDNFLAKFKLFSEDNLTDAEDYLGNGAAGLLFLFYRLILTPLESVSKGASWIPDWIINKLDLADIGSKDKKRY